MEEKNSITEVLTEEMMQRDIENLDEEEKRLFDAKRVEREFILNLIKCRKEKNLTQKQLAEKTGLTQQVISNIEKMDRRPSTFNLIRYLLGLDIDINKLFE